MTYSVPLWDDDDLPSAQDLDRAGLSSNELELSLLLVEHGIHPYNLPRLAPGVLTERGYLRLTGRAFGGVLETTRVPWTVPHAVRDRLLELGGFQPGGRNESVDQLLYEYLAENSTWSVEDWQRVVRLSRRTSLQKLFGDDLATADLD